MQILERPERGELNWATKRVLQTFLVDGLTKFIGLCKSGSVNCFTQRQIFVGERPPSPVNRSAVVYPNNGSEGIAVRSNPLRSSGEIAATPPQAKLLGTHPRRRRTIL